MIKLIAIDLDGTLYNSQHEVTPRGREAVHAALAEGIHPVVVTGRGRRGAERALETLGIDLPYICSAGALVRPGFDGPALFAWSYHVHAEMLEIIEFALRNPDLGLISEVPSGRPYWFGPDVMAAGMDDLTTREMFKSIRVTSPREELNQPLLKTTLVADTPLLLQVARLMDERCPSLDHVFAGPMYLDVTARNINKGRALQALAAHLGVGMDETAAMGDQYIDLHMLRLAGLSVAMGNAVPEVIQSARWVAPTNDEDGAARAIEKIIALNRGEVPLQDGQDDEPTFRL